MSVTGKSAYGITGTTNSGEVYDEIMTNNDHLTELTGERPRYFRPGTAYMDEVSADIVRSLGLIPVGFTINGDAGLARALTLMKDRGEIFLPLHQTSST